MIPTKETVKLSNDVLLMSEVERNQNLICVGDKIYSQGGDTYIVTELFEGGFSGKMEELEDNFFFDELQKGWDIAESTKKKHKANDRFEYI